MLPQTGRIHTILTRTRMVTRSLSYQRKGSRTTTSAPNTDTQTGSRHSPSTTRTPLRANRRRHSCISPCTPASRAFPETPARSQRTVRARTTLSAGRCGSSTSSSRRKRAFGRGIVNTRKGCGCGRSSHCVTGDTSAGKGWSSARYCSSGHDPSSASGRVSPVVGDMGRCRAVLIDSEMRFRPCAASSAASWGAM